MIAPTHGAMGLLALAPIPPSPAWAKGSKGRVPSKAPPEADFPSAPPSPSARLEPVENGDYRPPRTWTAQ
jgi:hypothetical protein